MPRKGSREKTAEQRKLIAQGKCGAKLRNKKTQKARHKYCTKTAGWGTDHLGSGACKLHGGNMKTHVRAAQQREAAKAVQQYGLDRVVDPHTALLEELARTAGHVDWLRVQIGGLADNELVGPIGQEGPSESGGYHHPQVERSVWIQLYQDERKHLTQVAATCIKVGIEERRVALAEQQGQMIAKVIQGVLGELKIEPEVARPILRKHLAMVSAEVHEGTARPAITQASNGNS